MGSDGADWEGFCVCPQFPEGMDPNTNVPLQGESQLGFENGRRLIRNQASRGKARWTDHRQEATPSQDWRLSSGDHLLSQSAACGLDAPSESDPSRAILPGIPPRSGPGARMDDLSAHGNQSAASPFLGPAMDCRSGCPIDGH